MLFVGVRDEQKRALVSRASAHLTGVGESVESERLAVLQVCGKAFPVHHELSTDAHEVLLVRVCGMLCMRKRQQVMASTSDPHGVDNAAGAYLLVLRPLAQQGL